MELIKIERVKFSKKEYEAFELVEKCLDGILREAKHPVLCSLATSILDNLYDLDLTFIEADLEEEKEEPIEETTNEEPTEEEHCWDERHISSQFELNP